MALKKDAIGKSWPASEYEVGREKIGEYARVIGMDDPIYYDRDAARGAGFRDVVAPPMFCVVYSSGAMGPVLFDPEVGINFAAMVHGGQEFKWGVPVCSGDLITTTASCSDIYEKLDKGFYVFESVSTNQDGEEVVRAVWTNIVRGI
jgi:acyl dehydratase